MPRFGAIYWPAYTAQARTNSQWYTNNQLSPGQYHTRAPWFSQELSAHTLYINKTQAQMDQDCIYARDGGIKYWLFGWYGVAGEPGDGNNVLQGEFKMYQASPNKTMVNWCMNIAMQTFVGYVSSDLTKLINYVKQTNYEKVLGNRPLIFFGHNEGSNTTGVAAAVTTFRAACSSNGAGDPYIVVMNFDPALATTAIAAVGAQAITTYTRAVSGIGAKFSFASSIADQQTQWENGWKPTGSKLVPNVTAGWNKLPIQSRGFPGDSYGRSGTEACMYDYVVPATAAELATLATACKTFMSANAAQCEADTALWYAWNEHTEGGYLCPLWSSTGPNKTRLDALASVHNS
jgi:hypothetical protein